MIDAVTVLGAAVMLLIGLGLPIAWQMGRDSINTTARDREIFDRGYERGKRVGEMMARGDWARHGVSTTAQRQRVN